MHHHHHHQAGSQVGAQSHKDHACEIHLQVDHQRHASEVQSGKGDLDQVSQMHPLQTAQDFGEEAKRKGKGRTKAKEQEDLAEQAGSLLLK